MPIFDKVFIPLVYVYASYTAYILDGPNTFS